jgi:hypothetical protein
MKYIIFSIKESGKELFLELQAEGEDVVLVEQNSFADYIQKLKEVEDKSDYIIVFDCYEEEVLAKELEDEGFTVEFSDEREVENEHGDNLDWSQEISKLQDNLGSLKSSIIDPKPLLDLLDKKVATNAESLKKELLARLEAIQEAIPSNTELINDVKKLSLSLQAGEKTFKELQAVDEEIKKLIATKVAMTEFKDDQNRQDDLIKKNKDEIEKLWKELKLLAREALREHGDIVQGTTRLSLYADGVTLNDVFNDLDIIAGDNITLAKGTDTTNRRTTLTIDATAVSALADLTDVNLTGLADGNMIIWDETTEKWVVTAPTDSDEKVKLNASDPTAGYLDDKITGYGFLTAETDPVFSAWLIATPPLYSLAFAGLTDYPADAAGALTNDGSGNLSWVPAGGGSQTPWTSDIDGDGYDLSGAGQIEGIGGGWGAKGYLGYYDSIGGVEYAVYGDRVGGSSAGYFYDSSSGNISAELVTGSKAGVFKDGTNTITLADGTIAGKFTDGSITMDLADGTYAFKATGNTLLLDNYKSYYGTGADASISYDGTNMIINPKEVGTGTLYMDGRFELLNAGDNLKIAIGVNAGKGGFGTNSIYIGNGAGYTAGYTNSATTNIGIGYDALGRQQTGGENIAIGSQTLWNSASGTKRSIAIGKQAGFYSNSIEDEVYVGIYAGYNSVSGSRNTFVGAYAGQGGSSASPHYNTALGYGALNAITSGRYNTAIGYATGGGVTTGTGNIFLGATAGVSLGNVSNVLSVTGINHGANQPTKSIIYGTMSATTADQDLFLNADVFLRADNRKLFLGAGDDVSLTYDGTNLLLNPKVVGTGYFNIQGQTLVDDKISFTQTDGNEYIDSLADGTLDANATTSIGFGIGGTQQVILSDGVFAPTTNNDIDLGDDTHRFKDLYLVGSSIHLGVSGDEGTIKYDTTNNVINLSVGIGDNAGTPVLSIDQNNRILYASNGTTSALNYSSPSGMTGELACYWTGDYDSDVSVADNWLNGKIPTSADLVIIDSANVYYNYPSTGTLVANKVILRGTAYLGTGIEVKADCVFEDTTYNYGGSITGTAIFRDTSYNSHIVTGRAFFFDSSYNNASVYGVAQFFDSAYDNYGTYYGFKDTTSSILWGVDGEEFIHFADQKVKAIHAARNGSVVSDGTYTVGIGGTTNGTITITDGVITAVQEAVA